MIRPERFREAAARAGSVSVGDVLHLHGRATWPALLIVLAALSTIPIAGVGTALSLPLFAIAWRWPSSLRRMPGAGLPLPERVRSLQIGACWSPRCLRLFATLHDTARSLMRRRWAGLRHPRIATAWRAWIAAMALVILLPLPFGNVLPALSLSLLGLGWIHRDGLALLLSLGVGAAAVGYAALSAHLLAALVTRVLALWA